MIANNVQNVFYVFLVCFVLFLNVNSDSNVKHRTVKTNDGQVRGLLKTTLIKKLDYYSFKGIPYAKPPTGELRFKAPEPVEPWSPKVIDAFEHGSICLQQPAVALDISNMQSEDCLFLNIYVPADIKPDEKLAVMVHIHGGGYNVGSGDSGFNLGPDFLLEQRVIVATLNYRLGVFGFLSLGTPEYSGNMGLKDQQLALKWIHSNIEHFSGDSNRITLFGLSAGGTSTHLQMFSSESRKYFRNVIPMSGVADNYWALSAKSDYLDLAHHIAKDLGKTKQTTEELIEFFKSTPGDKLTPYGSMQGFMKRTCDPDFRPVIERRDAIRPFIVDEPSKIYEESNIEIDAIYSFAQYEFIIFYSKFAGEIYDLKGLDGNFSLKLPFRDADLSFDSEIYKRLAKKIRQLYFKDAAIDENTLKEYIDLLSDVNFAYGINKAVQQHAMKTNSKAYYIRFSVDSKLSVMKNALGGGNIAGASHGDDICHVFRCDSIQNVYDEILQNPNDKQSKIALDTIEYLTKLYTNFAKYGNPVHNGDPIDELKPVRKDQLHFLDITEDGLKLGVNPDKERYDLWAEIDQLFQKISADTGIVNDRDEL